MDPTPDIDRSQGRALFGRDPSLYDRARPGYPERVFEVLTARCGLGAGSRVFEVGAGSGRATARLAEAGAEVTAIEPDPRLAGFLGDGVGKRFPEVSVHVASFEEDSLRPSSFDLGVAATSFHWVDPSAGLAKVRRLLVPGGWWAMWWNVFMDVERPDAFFKATGPILAPLSRTPSAGVDGSPPFPLDVERRSADLRAAGFSEIEAEVLRWSVVLDSAQIRALYSTFSLISALPAEEREGVLDAVEAIAEDSFGGRVERPFQTALYTARCP